MSSEKRRHAALFLFDLYSAILKIEHYVESLNDAEALKYDFKTWDAVMHEFTIMGEAAKHLLKDGWLAPEDRVVVDFRNIIVHHYFGLDAEDVWETIHRAMPPFKTRIEETIAAIERDERREWIENYMREPMPCYVKQAFETMKNFDKKEHSESTKGEAP